MKTLRHTITSLLWIGASILMPSSVLQAQDLKDLNGFFPFHVPESLEAWEERKALLKRRVLIANGLYPLPERTPLKAVIHGKVERPDFTVEKVYFESYPGLHVTGLLFRPAKADPGQKFPAVLSPHGHGGRLQDHGEDGVQARIKIGDEKFVDSGRFPKVARCANLARLGCVVLLYDMIGYADNQQLDMQVGHRIRELGSNWTGLSGWGFYSAQAELRLQSVFGVQTWNSIRGIDFLQSLPDVDPGRIAVTGGSGGGTQTIMVCAIDDRPIAAFPNGMVSSSMQGGCVCENASLLRIGTGNVELTALFAPKPQGMTAADDWTREMLVPGKGFPELQRLYTMYGKPDHVICGDLLRFKHNYNVVTRELMYDWFNRHLQLGHQGALEEADFRALTSEEHAVYNDEHPRPEGGDGFQRKLNRWLAETSDQQLAALEAGERNQIIVSAWQTIVGLDDPVAPAPCPPAENGLVTIVVKLPADRPEQTAIVPNPRLIPAYTHGYNHSWFAQRAREVYARILSAQAAGHRVGLVAEPGMEAITLAAGVIAQQGTIALVSLARDEFRFRTITDWRDPNFVPGAVKYGDLPGLLDASEWLGIKVDVATNAFDPKTLFQATPWTKPGLFTRGIEGPACDRDGNLYAVSFGEKRTIGRVSPDGQAEAWLQLPEGSTGNGIRFNRGGEMFVADYTGHNVLKVDPGTKEVSVLAHDPTMHQPNDLAISPDGTLYASDPDWKNNDGALWRISPDGAVTKLADGKGTTNGIEVSPDGKTLFVAESRQRRVLAYALTAGGISNERTLIEFEDHGLDGIRCDVDGNLYVTRHGAGLVLKLSPTGQVLRTIELPGSMPSNLCFGGPDGRTVYVTEVENQQVLRFRSDRPGLAWQRWQRWQRWQQDPTN